MNNIELCVDSPRLGQRAYASDPAKEHSAAFHSALVAETLGIRARSQSGRSMLRGAISEQICVPDSETLTSYRRTYLEFVFANDPTVHELSDEDVNSMFEYLHPSPEPESQNPHISW